MRFFATPDKHVHFDEIPAVGADWLKNISQAIESGRDSDTVESRLFPLPAEGAETEEICADWKAHVQPGLHEWFQSTSSLVREDVRGMKQEGDDFSLSIPVSHIGGWLNALNQARLVLAELHKLGEKDLNRKRRGAKNSEKNLAIIRVDFYALIQECLLHYLEEKDILP